MLRPMTSIQAEARRPRLLPVPAESEAESGRPEAAAAGARDARIERLRAKLESERPEAAAARARRPRRLPVPGWYTDCRRAEHEPGSAAGAAAAGAGGDTAAEATEAVEA